MRRQTKSTLPRLRSTVEACDSDRSGVGVPCADKRNVLSHATGLLPDTELFDVRCGTNAISVRRPRCYRNTVCRDGARPHLVAASTNIFRIDAASSVTPGRSSRRRLRRRRRRSRRRRCRQRARARRCHLGRGGRDRRGSRPVDVWHAFNVVAQLDLRRVSAVTVVSDAFSTGLTFEASCASQLRLYGLSN